MRRFAALLVASIAGAPLPPLPHAHRPSRRPRRKRTRPTPGCESPSCRRLLLGRAGRLPARQGREQRRLRLRRRRAEDRRLRNRQQRRHRPRRKRRGDLRPQTGVLRQDPADLFRRGARPDAAQPPGARYGHAIPLGDFPAERGAGQDREGLHRPARRRARLQEADRHQDRHHEGGVLPGRGLSPGLPDPPPLPALHRHQRRAQGGAAQGAVSGCVARYAGDGGAGATRASRPAPTFSRSAISTMVLR